MIKLKGKGGFTLLELMIVIVIIGILATVSIPMYGRMRARARSANAAAVIASIHIGVKAEMDEGESGANIVTHVATGEVGDINYLGMTPVINNDGTWTYTYVTADNTILATKNADPQNAATVILDLDDMSYSGTYVPLPEP